MPLPIRYLNVRHLFSNFNIFRPTPTAVDEENALDQALKKKKLSKVNLDDYDTKPNDEKEVIDDEDDPDDPILENVNGASEELASSPLWTLPLYAKLDPKEQAKVRFYNMSTICLLFFVYILIFYFRYLSPHQKTTDFVLCLQTLLRRV